jgi:hypothetical protein
MAAAAEIMPHLICLTASLAGGLTLPYLAEKARLLAHRH